MGSQVRLGDAAHTPRKRLDTAWRSARSAGRLGPSHAGLAFRLCRLRGVARLGGAHRRGRRGGPSARHDGGQDALPVLGVPVESAVLRGVDSLLSIVQMPAGVPVGTLAIGRAGAVNAALLAAAILRLKHPDDSRRARRSTAPRRPTACSTSPTRGPRAAMTVGISAAGSSAACWPWPACRSGCSSASRSRDEAATDAVAERVVGEYDDYAALADFVRGLDVVTYEFENVPVATARWLPNACRCSRRPSLEVAQDRVEEKKFFRRVGRSAPAFRAVDNRDEFDAADRRHRTAGGAQDARFGYDGKGQRVLAEPADATPRGNSSAVGR